MFDAPNLLLANHWIDHPSRSTSSSVGLYNSIKSFFHIQPLLPPPPYTWLITMWSARLLSLSVDLSSTGSNALASSFTSSVSPLSPLSPLSSVSSFSPLSPLSSSTFSGMSASLSLSASLGLALFSPPLELSAPYAFVRFESVFMAKPGTTSRFIHMATDRNKLNSFLKFITLPLLPFCGTTYLNFII